MPLRDYTKSFSTDETLQVVICVMQKSVGNSSNSPVNQMLETLQLELIQKRKARCAEELGFKQDKEPQIERSEFETDWMKRNPLEISFVYGTPYPQVLDFITVKEDTPIYYKEPVQYDWNRVDETCALSQLWFMSLAMLEKQRYRQGNTRAVQSRLYLITDKEEFWEEDIKRIVSGSPPELHPRFRSLPFRPYLWKTKDADGGDLERYIEKRGEVKMLERRKINDHFYWAFVK